MFVCFTNNEIIELDKSDQLYDVVEDKILRQRCKIVQQSFRFKSKTYMYHPK